MNDRKIHLDPEAAKLALTDVARENIVLSSIGFISTDELLIQVEDNDIAVRKRSHVGNATCPSVTLRLIGENDGTLIQSKSVLASTGFWPILFATLLLSSVLAVSIIALFFNSHNPNAWVFALVSSGPLMYVWAHALKAKRDTEAATARLIDVIWRPKCSLIGNQESIEKGPELPVIAQDPCVLALGAAPAQYKQNPVKHSDSDLASALASPCGASPPQRRIEELRSPLSLPFVPTDSSPARLSVPYSTELILQALRKHEQSASQTIPQSLGLGNKRCFSIKTRQGGAIIRRIRPTNSWLFRFLSHSIDLDLGPGLAIRFADDERECAILTLTTSTTLFRKLWTMALYTFVFPLGILGGFLPFFLLAGLLANNTSMALNSFVLLLVVGGSGWTMLEADGADKTEYVEMLSYLGEVLSELTPPRPDVIAGTLLHARIGQESGGPSCPS